ncbi:MAG: hypothetical protein H7A21_14510 [Spirochaetales bacterium]|nr:hypothetical protein [Spirochaetales bacterium]
MRRHGPPPLRVFQCKEIQELPTKDRDYVLQVIDDLLTTRRFREMAAR